MKKCIAHHHTLVLVDGERACPECLYWDLRRTLKRESEQGHRVLEAERSIKVLEGIIVKMERAFNA